MSTNVLTPFSYADVEIPEIILENEVENVVKTGETPEYIEEFPENASNDLWELEQENLEDKTPDDILTDVQDDIKIPATDESEKDFSENQDNGWNIDENQIIYEINSPKEWADNLENNSKIQDNTKNNENETIEIEEQWLENEQENIDENLELEKIQEPKIMGVISWTSTTLLPWQEFNQKLKKLAGQTSATYDTQNTTITQIIYTWTIPEGATITWLSTTNSQYPVYAWFTEWIIYYTSEAEIINMNSNSSYMFSNMRWITWLDLSNFNTSGVTNMSYMFYYSNQLTELNLSNWDTSKVTNMSYMFYYCQNLESIYTNSQFETTKTTSHNYMFYNDTKLIWWNWTVYSGSKIDKTYAKIDQPWQVWYFIDSDEIVVRFMESVNKEYTTQTVKLWENAMQPDTNPSKEWATFEKWITKNGEEYDFNTEVKKYTEIYAKFDSNDATLLPWKEFNQILKRLAWQSSATYDTWNETVKQIIQTWNIPSWVVTESISVPYSDNDILVRYKKWIIYYYTDAEKIYMNQDSSHMFHNFTQLTNLDISKFDAGNVVDMSYIFYYCNNLTWLLDLSNWDTSNVTNMSYMFRYMWKITKIDISSFDTSNVTNMTYMFENCGNSLTIIYAGTWFTTTWVTNSSYMFTKNTKLIWWNGTRYNDSKTDKTYAKIDNQSQSGYFTDKNAITVKFISEWIDYEIQTVNFGDKAIRPNTDPSKEWAIFKKWIDKDRQEYDFTNMDIDGYTEIYATFNTSEAILKPWKEFNQILKRLSWQSDAKYGTSNNTIKQIIYRTWNIPTWVTTQSISPTYSDNDVKAWYKSWIIYYHTEAETIYMNPDSSYMFNFMLWLTWLDLTNLDTSNVINMSYMFGTYDSNFYTYNLAKLDISNWDTSNVTDMNHMFHNCGNLTWLDVSRWDTSNVEDMSSMFWYCNKLESLDLSKRNTSKVTSLNSMFSYCNSLTWLDLSSFNTSNVTNMNAMFNGCSNLKTIYTSSWFKTDGIPESNSNNIFSNNIKLVWWNGTKFNENIVNKTYAKADTYSQSWYFTDKNTDIRINFLTYSGVGIYDTVYESQLVQYWEQAIQPATNPQKEWTIFKRWIDNKGAEYNFDSEITEYTEIYADFSSGGVAMLLPGIQFVKIIKELAWQTGVNNEYWDNTTINQIIQWTWNSIPSWVTTWIISIPYSDSEIIAWFTWWILYYYTDAEIIYMNPDSSYMFYYMKWLTWLDLNNRNASKVTNMSYMFYYCDNISRLDLNSWDVSSVTTMKSMFNGCSSLTWLDLSNWNTNKVANISYMFYNCSKLENLDLSNWNTNKVTNINFIFYNCNKLNQLYLSWWNFSNLSLSSYNPFYYSTIKRLDLSNATFSWSMYDVFYNMTNLEEINLSGADMSNVTNMSYMFYNCSNLVDIKWLDTWDTSNVTNMQDMFYNESSLTSLDLSSWDTSNVTDMSYMFNGCSNLTELNLDGWNFSKINSYYNYPLRNNSTIKRLSLSNAIFSWSMNESFYYMTSLEEINLGDADVSNVTNMQEMFRNCENLREIKWLKTWDTSNVTNMYEMFEWCANLMWLDVSKWNTSKVTNMGSMFRECKSLTWLDLSSFDTSNVTSISSIFYGCTKLEELNLSGWDLSKVQYVYASYWWWNDTNMPLKKLNMTNVKFSWSISSLFNYVKNLEELILDWVDTSNVTNMNNMFGSSDKLTSLDLSSFDTSNVTDMSYMFYNCSSLTWLDLSSFDTSKVTSISSMFYNTPNLKTIYASDKFVTNTLIYNPTDLFYNSINVIWWNGTKFDSWYIDKTYAKIDKVWQTWYFTDKNAINVKFINTLDWTETTSTFVKWQKLTPPSVDKYHVAWWYLDEEMTQEIDLNKWVDSYTVIYVKYDHNGSSGWWGGGWGWSTKPDTPKDEQQPAEPSQSDASSWTDVKEPETNTGSNAQTWSQVDPSEQTTQNDESNTQDSSTSSQNDGKTYST